MPRTPARPARSALAAVLALLLLVPSPAIPTAVAAAPQVTLLFDSEFGGYVPVVGGIERPDLSVRKNDGRAPESAKKALKRAKRGVRREEYPAGPGPLLVPRAAPARQVSRRWLRREAIATELLVLDGEGRPVEGARVYRYSDPSFYGVNQDSTGARLFDTWRLLPMPFPGRVAVDFVAAHEGYWRALEWAPVREITPNIDADYNPWTRAASSSRPPVELVGATDPAGHLRVVSGLFNLRDERRFPRAVVPGALRLGFLVVADGYRATVSEKRFTKGGTFENRTLQLLEAPDHALFTSPDWRAALRLADDVTLDGKTAPDLEEDVNALMQPLVLPLARVPGTSRDAAWTEALARLWERLGTRAPGARQLEFGRRALALTPDDGTRLFRVALLLAAAEGISAGDALGKEPVAASAALEEAEALLARAIDRQPRLLPPYRLLDHLLARRGARDDDRRAVVNRLLRESPFDPWGRARLAVFQLRAGRDAEAFDHLRYTYMAIPGLGGDRELARALSAHYWRVGLPEKAGAYAWLLTGRVPEDPFVRPRAAASPGRRS